MKLYVPKWAIDQNKLISEISNQIPEEVDDLLFYNYTESSNGTCVNWYIPSDYVETVNRLISCFVYEMSPTQLLAIERKGYVVVDIPLYDGVVYALENIDWVSDNAELLLVQKQVFKNSIFFKKK